MPQAGPAPTIHSVVPFAKGDSAALAGGGAPTVGCGVAES